MKLPEKIIFAASDLHIGSPLCRKETVRIIEHGIAQSDIAVFCGDILEGVGRHLPFKERLRRCKDAVSYWAEAAGKNGHLKPQFYIEGNHEVPFHGKKSGQDPEAAELCAAIKEHCKPLTHVYFHPKPWIQIGDMAFTHGNHELRYIDSVPNRLTPWMDRLVDIPTQYVMGGKVMEIYFPREKMARMLHAAFAEKSLQQPVNHIAFGHTHTPFHNYSIPELKLGGSNQDVRFHNMGTSYAGRELFNPLLIEFDGTDMVKQVKPCTPAELLARTRG